MSEQLEPPARETSLLWQRSRHLRYLAIGAWNTLAGYAIFAGLYLAFAQHLNYMIIAAISHLFAVTQSFVTQRWIVFRSSGNWLAEYLRFHIAHLGSLAIGLSALPIMVEVFKTSPLIAQAVVTALIVVASYFVHQHFTFRKAKDV
jgi:putative flippase GtrA